MDFCLHISVCDGKIFFSVYEKEKERLLGFSHLLHFAPVPCSLLYERPSTWAGTCVPTQRKPQGFSHWFPLKQQQVKFLSSSRRGDSSRSHLLRICPSWVVLEDSYLWYVDSSEKCEVIQVFEVGISEHVYFSSAITYCARSITSKPQHLTLVWGWIFKGKAVCHQKIWVRFLPVVVSDAFLAL